jgi:hypothetical protein
MKFQKGEIIVREDTRYPEGALVVDGFDTSGNLLAHPLGGGLQLIIPVSDIQRFKQATDLERIALFHRASFEIEGIEGKFNGWSDGTHWNGWAMPMFEVAEAQRLISLLGEGVGKYEASSDSFITEMEHGEAEIWQAEMIELPDGGRVKVYPIGAGSWIWDECGEEGA